MQHLNDGSYEIAPLGSLDHIEDDLEQLLGLTQLKQREPQLLESALSLIYETEYLDYFADITKHRNAWQTKENEDKFLIAEFVSGQELLVYTFSVNDIHYISTIQKYCKKNITTSFARACHTFIK